MKLWDVATRRALATLEGGAGERCAVHRICAGREGRGGQGAQTAR